MQYKCVYLTNNIDISSCLCLLLADERLDRRSSSFVSDPRDPVSDSIGHAGNRWQRYLRNYLSLHSHHQELVSQPHVQGQSWWFESELEVLADCPHRVLTLRNIGDAVVLSEVRTAPIRVHRFQLQSSFSIRTFR